MIGRRGFLKLAATAIIAPSWLPKGHQHLLVSSMDSDDVFVRAWNAVREDVIKSILAPHPVWAFLKEYA